MHYNRKKKVFLFVFSYDIKADEKFCINFFCFFVHKLPKKINQVLYPKTSLGSERLI